MRAPPLNKAIAIAGVGLVSILLLVAIKRRLSTKVYAPGAPATPKEPEEKRLLEKIGAVVFAVPVALFKAIKGE